MHSVCPHCSTRNSVFRVFTWWTGVHLRCRGCRRVVRVVESMGGLVMVSLAFAVGYIAGFVAFFDLGIGELLEGGDAAAVEQAAWLSALLPVLPAVIVTFAALGWVADRRGPPAEGEVREEPPGRWLYAVAYVLLTASIVALVGVVILGFLMQRLGEPMPDADPNVRLSQPLEVADEDAAAFVFLASDGVRRNLLDMRGRVVVLQLFEPGPMAVESALDSLARLRRKVLREDAQVIACALTDTEALEIFRSQTHVKMPFVRPVAALPAVLTPSEMPTTYVFDPRGRLVLEQVGVRRWDTDQMVQFIAGLKGG